MRRRTAAAAFTLAVLSLCAGLARADTTVPATLTLTWVLPTTAVDGTPLTGAQALTKIQVWVDTQPIPDTTPMPPLVELAGNVTSATQSMTVPNNSTLHARIRACNAGGCSDPTPEATKLVAIAGPNPPTSLTLDLKIVLQ